MELIKEVKESDLAYISNVCVHEDYRGKKIENKLINHVIEQYAQKYFEGIFLDVLVENTDAIQLYQKLVFEQFTEMFSDFNNPDFEQVVVFSMKYECRKSKKIDIS